MSELYVRRMCLDIQSKNWEQSRIDDLDIKKEQIINVFFDGDGKVVLVYWEEVDIIPVKSKKISTPKAKRLYEKVNEALEEYTKKNFVELERMQPHHFRLIMNGNTLDIYPKRNRACIVHEENMASNNRWETYGELIPFVEKFFGV